MMMEEKISVCTYSMLASGFIQSPPAIQYTTFPQYATKEDIEELKIQIKALERLLMAAREYDKVTGQTDCEDVDKIKLIQDIADKLGVEIEIY